RLRTGSPFADAATDRTARPFMAAHAWPCHARGPVLPWNRIHVAAVRGAADRAGLGARCAAAVATHALGRRRTAMAGRGTGAGGCRLRGAGYRGHAVAARRLAVAIDGTDPAPV